MRAPPSPPVRLATPESLASEAARARLIVPGLALMCTSALLGALFLLEFIVVASGTVMEGFERVPPEVQKSMHPFLLAGCAFAALANVFNFVAAIQMVRLRTWGVALAGCIGAGLPLFSNVCCVLTLPFSLWAIVVLVKPEIRAAFRRDAS
jgi:hypothetical protein